MKSSSFFCGRAVFAAALPLLAACNGSVHVEPADADAVADTLAADVAEDPDPCVVHSVFHDVRAYAPTGDGGEIVATGPAYGANGSAVVHKLDASCQPAWAFHAPPGDTLWILRVASDAAGNVIIAGSHSAASEPDPALRTGGALLLVMLDPGGHERWRVASPLGGRLSRIVLAPAGDVVVSGRAHDLQRGQWFDLVARYDDAGQQRWQRRCGDERARVNDLAVPDAGDVLLAGRFAEPFDFGGGLLTPAHAAGQMSTFDAFLVKLDAAGAHRWSARFGDERSQSLDRVSVDASGEVTVRGRGNGTIDLGGGALSLGESGTFGAGFDAEGRWLWSALDGAASSAP